VIQVTPDYWEDACKHLIAKDRVMKRLIPQFGSARLQNRGDAFTTLARSIVGQQISVKAAQSVWDRFMGVAQKAKAVSLARGHGLDATGDLGRQMASVGDVLHASQVLKLKIDDMRAAGLSARKVEYLVDLALHFENGSLHVADWQSMDDEVIVNELISIRGVGRWTAEMFLIFHLLRPNVLPLDDAGLIKGISQSYFSGEAVSRSDAREVAGAWAPFCSVATWYIWRSLDPLPVAY
jgi:DNA-3-methyladenine glycosylase II